MGEMDATATVGRRVAVPEGYGEKRCPRCEEVLFDDMDVCYGCLYDFGRNREEDLARAGIPEEFALLEGGLEGQGREAHARRLPGNDLRVWLRTDSADVILPLPGEGLVLGSDLSCDVVLHSILASPRHLRLVPADGGALAFDMDAGLPATVDGVPVGEGTLVAQGESVVVCVTRPWWESPSSTSSPEPPAVRGGEARPGRCYAPAGARPRPPRRFKWQNVTGGPSVAHSVPCSCFSPF